MREDNLWSVCQQACPPSTLGRVAFVAPVIAVAASSETMPSFACVANVLDYTAAADRRRSRPGSHSAF